MHLTFICHNRQHNKTWHFTCTSSFFLSFLIIHSTITKRYKSNSNTLNQWWKFCFVHQNKQNQMTHYINKGICCFVLYIHMYKNQLTPLTSVAWCSMFWKTMLLYVVRKSCNLNVEQYTITTAFSSLSFFFFFYVQNWVHRKCWYNIGVVHRKCCWYDGGVFWAGCLDFGSGLLLS